MPALKLAFLALGLALLGGLLAQADLADLWDSARRVGFAGMAVVLGVFALSFWADVASWHVILVGVPFDWRWSARLYAIRMVGEAYNNVTPMASVGGEPVKAWLLKTNYNIRLRESSASLVLAKTTIVMSLAAFVAGGLLMMLMHPALARDFTWAGAAALGMLVLFSVVFFLMQRLKLSSFVARGIGNGRFGRRLSGLIAFAEDLDARFLHFYSAHRVRLTSSLVFACVSWVLGMVEIYVAMLWLGAPITVPEAWIVEALVQTVRIGVFFIPSGLGAQDGAFMVIGQALTGDASAGLALALLRRCRELIWIAAGLLLASLYSVTLRRVSTELPAPDV